MSNTSIITVLRTSNIKVPLAEAGSFAEGTARHLAVTGHDDVWVAEANGYTSDWCFDALEAGDRLTARIQGLAINVAPDGVASPAEMQQVRDYYVAHAVRDSGGVVVALNKALTTGMNTPEWLAGTAIVAANADLLEG